MRELNVFCGRGISAEGVLQSLNHLRPCSKQCLSKVLLTAPHGVQRGIWPDSDDPCTFEISHRMDQQLKLNSCLFVATVPRGRGDQNRLGPCEKLNDMWLKLNTFAPYPKSLCDTFHVDVHSVPLSATHSLNWGQGVNIIHLHGEEEQRSIANKFRKILDDESKTVADLPPATVVEMGCLPNSTEDQNSNAMIEWSRSRGARSLLIEIPTNEVGGVHRFAYGNVEGVESDPTLAFANVLAKAVSRMITR